MPNALKDNGLLIEAVTRARKTVICVTNPGSEFHDIFESAVNHHGTQSCDYGGSEHGCPFIGSTTILQIDQVPNFFKSIWDYSILLA